MTKEKFSRCPQCGVGKIMTDSLRREYNSRSEGKIACADCKVREIYERFGL